MEQVITLLCRGGGHEALRPRSASLGASDDAVLGGFANLPCSNRRNLPLIEEAGRHQRCRW